ncbi:hypothetical protein Dsin_024504 [Dipteronia sinensis]|uniref:Reverse transcriptase n=1 Tax=Dipteronia sinensis TaxID=43782 RepID=A0AAD9ZUD3_9ROSI|nr:hypothetical protein Dsin_024504 [Dipteronia sinensis]
MCVSRKVSKDRATSLANILGVQLVDCHERYLGLPNFAGKNKKQLFSSIKDRVWGRLQGWQNKLFSTRGKRGASESCYTDKNRGGLGFHDLSIFNKAILTKQVWRLIHQPNTLAGKVLKQRYFPNSSVIEVSYGNSSSFLWRSLM